MSYKLTYFDINARGEPARLIFTAAGVKFTDNRVKFEDWPALKQSKLPFLRDYLNGFIYVIYIL